MLTASGRVTCGLSRTQVSARDELLFRLFLFACVCVCVLRLLIMLCCLCVWGRGSGSGNLRAVDRHVHLFTA